MEIKNPCAFILPVSEGSTHEKRTDLGGVKTIAKALLMTSGISLSMYLRKNRNYQSAAKHIIALPYLLLHPYWLASELSSHNSVIILPLRLDSRRHLFCGPLTR